MDKMLIRNDVKKTGGLKHGGARTGAGRKPMSDEPTETIAFRIPGSMKKGLQDKFGNKLNQEFFKWVKRKIK